MSETEGGGMHHDSRQTPPSLDGLVAALQSTPSYPHAGEIWRAAWARCVQLVLIVAVRDTDVDAVPLSPDVELGDDATVSLETHGPLTHPLGAWMTLGRQLPVRVLDVRLGTLTQAKLNEIGDARPVGAPITSPLDERSQVRMRLAERMDELADAAWVPENAEPVDLATAIREHGLAPSAIARELGVAPGEVTAMVRGDRAPSTEQSLILGPLLSVAPERLVTVQVDDDLVWALDRPQFRRELAERGRAEGVADEAAWRLHVATRELPLAARTTGSTDPRQRWIGLIRDYLDAR